MICRVYIILIAEIVLNSDLIGQLLNYKENLFDGHHDEYRILALIVDQDQAVINYLPSAPLKSFFLVRARARSYKYA